MWIEFQLECLDSAPKECLVNSDHLVGFTYFYNDEDEAIFQIIFQNDVDEFKFLSLETANEVFNAFKGAINGYSATIDKIGYVRSLSSSRYEAGTLCAPAELVDWRRHP